MDNRTRSALCAAVAMAAGGFVYSVTATLPTLARAGLVGAVAALVMVAVSFAVFRPQKSN